MLLHETGGVGLGTMDGEGETPGDDDGEGDGVVDGLGDAFKTVNWNVHVPI